MYYKIIEARIEFGDNNSIKRITVLVDCTSESCKPLTDVRAIFATNKPVSGYYFLMSDATCNNDLLQKVAAQGMQTVDRNEIFPNWKKKHGEKLLHQNC